MGCKKPGYSCFSLNFRFTVFGNCWCDLCRLPLNSSFSLKTTLIKLIRKHTFLLTLPRTLRTSRDTCVPTSRPPCLFHGGAELLRNLPGLFVLIPPVEVRLPRRLFYPGAVPGETGCALNLGAGQCPGNMRPREGSCCLLQSCDSLGQGRPVQ